VTGHIREGGRQPLPQVPENSAEGRNKEAQARMQSGTSPVSPYIPVLN